MLALRHKRVVDAAPPPVLEAGEPPAGPLTRVALVAHWAPGTRVSKSLRALVDELVAGDFRVVVASAAAGNGPLDWPDRPAQVCVYRRANIGYDFGSWAQILQLHPHLAGANLVILANDSLVGPFRSLKPILADVEAAERPVWGLVSTTQDAPHLQSHFVAYKGGILQHRAVARFWRNIRVQPTKRELIVAYEIGLARVLRDHGIPYGACYPFDQVVVRGANPTSLGWRRLLQWGFPFVKRELVLRPPPEVPDAADVPAVVAELFGEDVFAWV